jgi:hypothetical protein
MSFVLRAAAAGVSALLVPAVSARAQPDPAPTPLPSEVTLTVAHGDSLENATDRRTVLLTCSPVVAGTHPDPAAACAELSAAGGDFDRLPGRTRLMCPMIWDPVTLAADGVWNGVPVEYRHTFPNACGAGNHGAAVFRF